MSTAMLLLILLVGGWVSWVDIREFRIPDSAIALGLSASLTATFVGLLSPSSFLAGTLTATAQMLGIRLITRDRLGLGDVKLGIFLGGILGPLRWIIAAAAASMMMLLCFMPRIISRKADKQEFVPLAPALTACSLLCAYIPENLT